MKTSCTHFQSSAGAFTYIRDYYNSGYSSDLSHPALSINISLMLVRYTHTCCLSYTDTDTYLQYTKYIRVIAPTQTLMVFIKSDSVLICLCLRVRLRSVSLRKHCWTTGGAFWLPVSVPRWESVMKCVCVYSLVSVSFWPGFFLQVCDYYRECTRVLESSECVSGKKEWRKLLWMKISYFSALTHVSGWRLAHSNAQFIHKQHSVE